MPLDRQQCAVVEASNGRSLLIQGIDDRRGIEERDRLRAAAARPKPDP
jgi:hypothetical protein